MAATYDSTLTTDKDRVRWLIGDTDVGTDDDSNNAVAQDEEILWALTQEKNIYMAGGAVALAVGRKLRSGGIQDLLVGETRIRYDRALELLALANELRARGSTYKQPSAGGVFVADTTSYDENTALEQPNVAVGMHDNPQSGDQSSTASVRRTV